MPVTPTKARLWFATKEQEEAYDDKMIANIELKSTDFDDENFSPVFSRATQEVFLEPNDRFNSEFLKMFGPLRSNTYKNAIDNYILFPQDSTYNRSWTVSKFVGGFGISYLIMRELPFRNFYARCFIMTLFASKFLDHVGSLLPFRFDILAAYDRYHHRDLRCYDVVNDTFFYKTGSIANDVSEGAKWKGRQPGHMHFSNYSHLSHLGKRFAAPQRVGWDGTMNMPLYRLTDPKHKDSYMMSSQ